MTLVTFRCGACGAPVAPGANDSLHCGYCGTHQQSDAPPPAGRIDLLEAELRCYRLDQQLTALQAEWERKVPQFHVGHPRSPGLPTSERCTGLILLTVIGNGVLFFVLCGMTGAISPACLLTLVSLATCTAGCVVAWEHLQTFERTRSSYLAEASRLARELTAARERFAHMQAAQDPSPGWPHRARISGCGRPVSRR